MVGVESDLGLAAVLRVAVHDDDVGLAEFEQNSALDAYKRHRGEWTAIENSDIFYNYVFRHITVDDSVSLHLDF